MFEKALFLPVIKPPTAVASKTPSVWDGSCIAYLATAVWSHGESTYDQAIHDVQFRATEIG